MKDKINLFFDIDGTLYPNGQDKFIGSSVYESMKSRSIDYISHEKNIDSDEARRIYDEIFLDYGVRLSVGIEKRLGLNRKKYMDYSWDMDPSKFMDKNIELVRLLSRLRSKNSMFVVSDAPSVWINNVVRFLEIDECFIEYFSGAELNLRKDEGLYSFILNSLNAKPANCYMIGDDSKLDKDLPALLGIKTILISRTPDLTKNEIDDILNIENLI